MTKPKRQLHLGAFLQGVGRHLAAWRHPDVDPAGAVQLSHFKNLARIAEAAKFDAIFLADNVGLPDAPPAASTTRPSCTAWRIRERITR
jgi:alkanesulfonate monooxygenase SsuD/methylene tetrahydromethanopterin reductase-like flavin-dependent oxidoreductase (luciferase family)